MRDGKQINLTMGNLMKGST